ncbi:MAG: putative inorganic carbon transporter subunit DabA [Candidatus Nanopelagicales bacterium]
MTSLRTTAAILQLAALLAVAGLIGVLTGASPGFQGPMLDLGPFGSTSIGATLTGPTATLLVLITVVGAMVATYSARNLQGQHRLHRFAALELVAVLSLALSVTTTSLVLLALGWTAAGLAMSGLVGHPGTARARSAQRTTRRALLLGDVLLWSAVAAAGLGLGTLQVGELGAAVAGSGSVIVTATALLVVAAGVVRSALVPAHRWLPEVAEGPSPVSALLHAGFVNSIGVLALLLWPLLAASTPARGAAIALGVVTVLVASAQQRVRPDVKGRLASSTSAQMGYVAITVGLGLPGAVLLHVVGHGLWKAALFLGAGGAIERVRTSPARADHAPEPASRDVAAGLAGLSGVLVVALGAGLPGPWGPSLWQTPAMLLPMAVVGLAAGVAARAAATGRYRSSTSLAVVLGAGLGYTLILRKVEHGLAGSFGVELATWGQPGAAGAALLVAILVALGGLAWRLDAQLRAGRLPRITASVARSTMPRAPRLRRTRVALRAMGERPVGGAPDRATTLAAADLAVDLVSPLWPLHGFVASNPLAGLEQLPFADALDAAAPAWGVRPGIDASMLRAALARGAVTEGALRQVSAGVAPGPDIAHAGSMHPRAELVAGLLRHDAAGVGQIDAARAALVAASIEATGGRQTATPAETGVRLEPGLASIQERARDLVSAYAARCYGLPAWPEGRGGVWAALRGDAAHLDTLIGAAGAQQWVAALPERACDALPLLVGELGLEPDDLVAALSRVLARDPGWVAHLAWRRRVELAGPDDETLDLLVARLALEVVVARAAGSRGVRGDRPAEPLDLAPVVAGLLDAAGIDAGSTRPDALAALAQIAEEVADRGIDMLRLAVWEESYRTPLLDHLGAVALDLATAEAVPEAPRAQLVTCIDVRSERLRRHLEGTGSWETLGAAGFFGIPLSYADANGAVTERLPALLRPQHLVTETTAGDPGSMAGAAEGVHALAGRVAAPFALAEAAGWITGPTALLHTLRPGSWDRLRAATASTFGAPVAQGLCIERGPDAPQGFALEELVAAAEAFLRTTGLLTPAPVVLLAGHGGYAANNPHVAAYDCGACGGQAGDVSARAMTQVLNDPRVRQHLGSRGITIPAATWFGAALHDTTRDRVLVLDAVPAHLRDTLAELEADLALACDAVAVERAALLPDRMPTGLAALRTRLDARAVDWAQVRPEWGLAGNAAIVFGPRSLTRSLDLDGRVFLHSYQPHSDADGSALEFLLSAPLVVAQWINSQYWFSTIAPERFGAGDKTTHNVLAAHDGGPAPLTGVVTGARGDLRIGLPWQAVSAEAPIEGTWPSLPQHAPVRLLAVVCADAQRVEDILAAHPEVSRLVLGEWISLVCVDPASGALTRRDPAAGWVPVHGSAGEAPIAVHVPVAEPVGALLR